MIIEPLYNNIILKNIKKNQKEETNGVKRGRLYQGEVVAAGEGKVTSKGTLIPTKVKPGDIVLYIVYGEEEFFIDNKSFISTEESNIIVILKP